MKKTYQIPSTEVLNVMPQTLMAGSIDIKEGGANDESKLLSRDRGGFWDDEEE